MCKKLVTAGSLVLMMTIAAPSFGSIIIVDEDFDPISAGAVVQLGYTFGDTSGFSSSSGIGTGTGNPGDSWQTVNATTPGQNAGSDYGFSGVGGQYQNGAITGNTSTNLSDYTLSFDAKADGGSLNIQIETWPDPGFGGSVTGKVNTAPADPGYGNDQSLFSEWTHYELNLGDTAVFMDDTGIDMSGGTIQLTFQFNGGGESPPVTQTLDVDNLMLTMVPEPSSMALVGLLVPALFLSRRKK